MARAQFCAILGLAARFKLGVHSRFGAHSRGWQRHPGQKGAVQAKQSISVIVPVWNGSDVVGGCVQALLSQTIDAGRYQVIVVDDGSSDTSGEIAARYGVQVIRQEHAGAAAARNRGALAAQGEILLFTDADCEPWPDWIEQMVAPFADPCVAGVKGIYRTRQRSLVARFAQAEYEEKYERLARSAWIDFVDTYAAAYRRAVFWEQGGFDPAFLLDEDQEFSFRLVEAGHKLAFAPEAVVFHRHQATVWGYMWRKVGLARWKVQVSRRYPAKAVRDSYTPWTQKAQIVLLLLTLIGLAAAALGALAWSIVGIAAALGLGCTAPLVVKARQQGWAVAAVAPALAWLRALALVAGLVWGSLDLILKPKKRELASPA